MTGPKHRPYALLLLLAPAGIALLLLLVALLEWNTLSGAGWVALAAAVAAVGALGAAVVRVIWPLIGLARRAEALASGHWDTLAAPARGVAELEVLRRALDGMAGHVRRAQSAGQAYTAALSEGQEAERARLAHELHDATIQSLIAIAQRLERAGRLVETDGARAQRIVAEARQDTLDAVSGLREIIAGLRPPALDELGLIPALELMVERQPAPPVAALHVEGRVRRLPPERELLALRMIQEGLSNVRRHAGATTAAVRVRFQPDALQVEVADDGHGILTSQTPDELAAQGHWGLLGLRERAARLGGTVDLVSESGRGTRLVMELPDPRPSQPEAATVDPVCKAVVLPDTAYGAVEHDGRTYYFCCPVCQGAFLQDPDKYAPSA
jgi:signal transduction histidine kinase/YHS domain-containing protein